MNTKPVFSFQEGRRTLDFGQFKVVEESNRLLTHRPSWRSATKVAQLLQLAYYAGYEAEKKIIVGGLSSDEIYVIFQKKE